MHDEFEPVLDVAEYYDGPRAGVALFQGVPYRFQSRMLDIHEYNGDFESVDIFELTMVGAPHNAPPLLACGTFRVVASEPVPATGQLRALEAHWRIFGHGGV